MSTQIQLRRGTAALWTSANPVLAAGEAGWETDSKRYKIGDGVTAWSSLPYAAPPVPNPAGGSDNYAPIDDPEFTGDAEFGGTIVVPTPSLAGHAANKAYVDAAVVATIPVGAVMPWAGDQDYPPSGWYACNGQLLDKTTFAALYTVLKGVGVSSPYGENATHFALPDLRARFPLAMSTNPPNGGLSVRLRGATGGAETVTLSTAQIPSHTHDAIGAAKPLKPRTGVAGGSSVAWFGDSVASDDEVANGQELTGAAGGGGSHDNMPPWLAIGFIIKAT